MTGYTPFRARDVRAGDSLRAAVNDLLKEEAGYELQRSGVTRKWQMPNGTVLQQDAPPQQFWHPWYPILYGASVIFPTGGLVNGFQPTLEGIGLDGTRDDGTVTDAPQLQLVSPPSNPDLTTWIVVQMKVDPKSFQDVPPRSDLDAVTIVHVTEIDTVYRDGGPGNNLLGREPIAHVTWDVNQNVVAVDPVAMHNLSHLFVPVPGARGRHLFWAT